MSTESGPVDRVGFATEPYTPTGGAPSPLAMLVFALTPAVLGLLTGAMIMAEQRDTLNRHGLAECEMLHRDQVAITRCLFERAAARLNALGKPARGTEELR